ncbi:MAG: MoxR family ATPase [Verrucomicrobiales bacterium]|nr:MoxR family ATPase [Verrucomicrobiae bacterium]
MTSIDSFEQDKETVEVLMHSKAKIKAELAKVIVGMEEPIEQLLVSLFAGGHCLLTGAPGLAKTLLVNTVADVFSLNFSRVQFTPDLMPSDVTGTEILQETDSGRQMKFVKGPIFANMLLADEINRTPPKTQAALLEAMQEHQVTAAGRVYKLEQPFYVLATQNPIEMDGTYPLPEAQLDRFMFNVIIDYLPEADEIAVVGKTTKTDDSKPEHLFSGADLIRFQQVVRKVPVAEEIIRFAVRLATHSRPKNPSSPDFVNQYVSWGAGLRAGQNLILGGKARALLEGRSHVTREDVIALAPPVLRHRVLLNYRAEADSVSVEEIITKLIDHVK